jgi:DNA-binding NtrC family response regulator
MRTVAPHGPALPVWPVEYANVSSGQVLIASDAEIRGDWLSGVTTELNGRLVAVRRAWTASSTLDFVRRGGIDVAVLALEPPEAALRALRHIRSIDDGLPCMWVAQQVSPLMLRQAWSLSVASVLTQPVDVAFAAGLIERLVEQHRN